jgi:voltage-gated potassium channel
MLERLKNRTYLILEKGTEEDRASRIFDFMIMGLIFLNVVMVILETVADLAVKYAGEFAAFEVFSVTVFTVEYLLRVATCTASHDYQGSVKGRLRFMVTSLALIDLLAILPFFLQAVMVLDLRLVRMVRLLRLFQLFKMGRYVKSLRVLGHVVWEKRDELQVVAIVLFIMLVITSSLMYFVEHEAQPEAFSSIPAAMWWGIVTLTTVGYGDVYPITPLGRFLGTVIAVLGVGMFALPAGILSSGFVEALQTRQKHDALCPHCGRDITEPTG